MKSWRVERRWTTVRWVWRAPSESAAWDGYFFVQRTLRRGSLHLLNPRGQVVIWCTARDVRGLMKQPRVRRKAA